MTLFEVTREICDFLRIHAPHIPEHQHWTRAKGLVQHRYGLTPLGWACALNATKMPAHEVPETREADHKVPQEIYTIDETNQNNEINRKIFANTALQEQEQEQEQEQDNWGNSMPHSVFSMPDSIKISRQKVSSQEAEIQLSDFDWVFKHPEHADAPLSRMVGYGWFCGRPFHLNEATLDPRWESEGIIDLVERKYQGSEKILDHNRTIRILDVGTGSGCLLIELLMRYPQAMGWGVDLSLQALEAARKNAHRHGVSHRAHWIHSDGLDYFIGGDGVHRADCGQRTYTAERPSRHGPSSIAEIRSLENSLEKDGFIQEDRMRFDIIVSNPPYIACDFALPDEVTKWDPPLALYGGRDGMHAYRAWIEPILQKLEPGGICVFEIGWDQGQGVWDLCQKAGAPRDIHGGIERDHAEKDRYVWFQVKKF